MAVTITEEYTLPSLGKIYKKQFDPNVKFRSMTVAEEMKRLSPSKNQYKMMAEIIDDCLITKLPISAYDMCIGDYTYLLHKLRVTTYGPEYKISFICPKCGEISKIDYNLDDLKVKQWSKDIQSLMSITLPKTQKEVTLRFQTPRDLDHVAQKAREMKEKFPEMTGDPSILLTLETLIDTIDGEPLDPIMGLESLKQLPMADVNFLAQKATKLNEKVGIDTMITLECGKCGNSVKSTFRFTNEFFGPTID